MEQPSAIAMKSSDNVATAIVELREGEMSEVRIGKESKRILIHETIPFGFKFSLREIKKGEAILKYGEPIGLASVDILPGRVVHVHNVEGARGRGDLARKGE